jgi:acetyltransferase-like isoleucine patch superfamily enzyme
MKHSIIWKFISFFRFFVFKILNYKSLKGAKKGLVGKNCNLFLKYSNSITVINDKFFMLGYNEILNSGKLQIGTNFSMNCFSRIICLNSIKIGNNVMLAEFVSIIDHDHTYHLVNDKISLNGHTTSPIIIGDNVWISDKVSILKGVTIGNNVVIGANSVVTKDIPSNSIAVGCPARVVKSLL